jgi:hypothetical protein
MKNVRMDGPSVTAGVRDAPSMVDISRIVEISRPIVKRM